MIKCNIAIPERTCGRRARFKIMDIVCKFDDDSIFWVCEDCIKFFIPENTDDPHYIILEELKRKLKEKKE